MSEEFLKTAVSPSVKFTAHERYPPKDENAEERAKWLEAMKKGVRAAAYLGASYMVVHPLMPYGIEGMEYSEEILK